MSLASAWARLAAWFRQPGRRGAVPDGGSPIRDIAPAAPEGSPRFSFEQLSTLLAWASTRPGEPDMTITSDEEALSEAVLVFRRGNRQVRYLVTPTGRGTVALTEPSGARQELPTIDAALAAVLEIEGRIGKD